MLRALVTGFEPFGGASLNASYEAVRRLPQRMGALDIVTAELPTSYARSGAALLREIERTEPVIVLCVGEASERTALNVERVAVNMQTARIADNDGAQPLNVQIIGGAPSAYFATLPIIAIHEALTGAGLPAVSSNSAGTFVCNHVFYTLMHCGAGNAGKFRAGFLHVPSWRKDSYEHEYEAGSAAPMTLDDIVRGIGIVLATTAAR